MTDKEALDWGEALRTPIASQAIIVPVLVAPDKCNFYEMQSKHIEKNKFHGT